MYARFSSFEITVLQCPNQNPNFLLQMLLLDLIQEGPSYKNRIDQIKQSKYTILESFLTWISGLVPFGGDVCLLLKRIQINSRFKEDYRGKVSERRDVMSGCNVMRRLKC